MMDRKDRLIEELLEKIVQLEALVVEQAAQIKALEKRLSKNSKNSSKPPSSDGLGKSNKKKTQSLRKNSQKQSGGQSGHCGATLKQTQHPDTVIHHALKVCPNCDGELANIDVCSIVKRQVFDIPPPQLRVTEHQAEVKICPCCHARSMARFAPDVKAPAQYGPVLQSYAVYLHLQQLLPEARLQQTLSDLFNVKMATATINRFSENVYNNVNIFEEAVLEKIQQAGLKHLDETGFRVSGKTQWLHVASNADLTYYHFSPKRKSLLPGLIGTIVHDHWRPYYQIENVEDVLCNAHHLRELKSLIEDKERWAHQMWRLLLFSLAIKQHHGDAPIPKEKQQRLLAMYDTIVKQGLAHHEQLPPYKLTPTRGRKAKRPGHNLLVRLKLFKQDATRFIKEIDVPFTNNLAEQDLRMMKVKQKISGTFRSEKGAKQFIRCRAFISTARKQSWNILEAITQALAGNPPLPQ